MRARVVMYATLFTAGLEALAIYSTQEEAASGRVLAAQTAPAAPAPTVARAALPVAAPSVVPGRVYAATEPTRFARDAQKPANAARAAMASATEKLNNTRPLYDRVGRQYRMVRKHQMIRQQRWSAMSYTRSQPSQFSGSNY